MNETLKRLYELHAPALLLYARIWCRWSEDALQEAFIELAKQDEPPPDPVAWLYRAVKFRAINLNRGEQRRNRREQAMAYTKEPFFVPSADQKIDIADLEEALRALPDEHREIVVARIWGSLTFEQIAALNSSTSSTVHRRYRAAIEELKQKLDGLPCKGANHE